MKNNIYRMTGILVLLVGMIYLFPMNLMAAGQQVKVASFMTPAMQEVKIYEKESLEMVQSKLPEMLEAVSDLGDHLKIPVIWECVGDYEGTNYYYYQFVPVFDNEEYEVSEEIEIPYIWLVISSSEELARAVTSSANETKIYNFLVDDLDCNLATALGILANIERESSFNPKAQYPAKGEASYYGICQWGGSRLTDLKEFCSQKGYAYDSVEGQLNFLKHELYGNEFRAWEKMQGIEDTAEGAYLAGYNWARYFERCSSVYYEVSAKRARDVYWPKYITKAPVYRISGKTRYETGMKIADQLKEVLGVEKFNNVVIATGAGYADALSGSYLAYVKKAPILLKNGNNSAKIRQYLEKNMKTNGTVYLLGGEAAISAEFETQLSGYTIKRLAGKSRYDTNLEILKETGELPTELLVCTGKGFADSLSASASGKPILLVSDKLTDVQKEYLNSMNIEKVYIIGGESAVNAAVEAELAEYTVYSRISGGTRFETSTAVAKAFVPKAKSAVLAYSHNFPDGLCGGPLAAALKAPLVLTMTDKEKAAAKYVYANQIVSGYVLGGTGLISDDAVRNIFDLKVSDRITTY